MLLTIPSPGDPYVFHIGPFQPRWYGVILALAVLAGGWVARRGFVDRGLDPELVLPVGVAAVCVGLVGARVEHVASDWSPFSRDLSNAFWLWRGGLGIYGAVAGGLLGAAAACRLLRLPFWAVADCAAPGIALGQAIGRFGNYVNQELYGHPSGLPWSIRIDHPLPPFIPGQSFQPLFLYESLLDLAIAAVLVVVARRAGARLAAGAIFALYALLYAVVRLWMETMRIDPTDHVLGVRIDLWISAAVALAAATALARLAMRRPANP